MIHPTAVVDSVLPDDVQIGAYAVIGPEVQLGKGVRIGPHAYVTGPVFIDDSVSIGPSAVIGTDPQDLKYDGERTELFIGSGTVIREFANINRGTVESGRTVIGSDCLIMAYAHIAHDCIIGDRVIIANTVNMAGHVEIGSDVTVGGVVPIHQFVRIGDHAMIGGGYRVSKDVPPFVLAGGAPLGVRALNLIGLRRKGFSQERLNSLEQAFRYLFREEGTLTSKAGSLLEDRNTSDDARQLADFIISSSRGVIS
ncbi:MAG: acyl-ACP--UDP-N-acetylglucosamine O-acyltransferase [Candidatus Aegiribacteria sp.]|nr:acyl-ACP--UDP-N-acetylglucosamine O-acyltransferase [Candidatus Aegiribacteria sp.]